MTRFPATERPAGAPDTLAQSSASAGEADAQYGHSAGRPRAGDVEARMQDLIATASCLFVEKGYTNVSLELIARQAHVAVRTIYVKFGGKAGLFNAVIAAGRERFFSNIGDMDTDTRPIGAILTDFGMRFLELVTTPAAISMQRMVIAEAKTNAELANTFYETGPAQTRAILKRFFARPDIRAQLRDDVPFDLLPVHLLNCIMGDQLTLFMFELEAYPSEAEVQAKLERGLSLFFNGTLR